MIYLFAILRPWLALFLGSVLIGVPVTFWCAQVLHCLIECQFPPKFQFLSKTEPVTLTWAQVRQCGRKGWAQVVDFLKKREFPEDKDRVIWLAMLNGMITRGLVTGLVIWVQPAAGAVIAGLLVQQGLLGWGKFGPQVGPITVAGRARYNVSMLNMIISLTWAVGCGILGGA